MMARIGVILDTYKTYAYFGNNALADAQVMVDLDQLRREFPDQARTEAVRKTQAEFRQCINSWLPSTRQQCRQSFIGALEFLLL